MFCHHQFKPTQPTCLHILSTEPTYQNPPGTLYYPPTQENRGQPIILGGYPSYGPNMIPMHQGPGYHVELQPGPPNQPPTSQSQPIKSEGIHQKITHNFSNHDDLNVSHTLGKTVPGGAQVYHINLDQPPQPPMSVSQSVSKNQSLPSSSQPPTSVTMSHGKGHGPPPQPQITMEKLNDRGGYHPAHLPEAMYRMPILSLPPSMSQQVSLA